MIQDALTTVLTENLPETFTVKGYAAAIDVPGGPTVVLWPAGLTFHPEVPGQTYQVDFTIQVLTRYEDPELAEADLAESLSEVLGVLFEHDDYLVTKADRTVSEDNRIHSWTLTVTSGLELTAPEA